MAGKKPTVIPCDPRGWWFNEGRAEDQWSGPFDTPEEAEKAARSLAPDRSKSIKLMQVQAWEKREILIQRYRKCTSCRDGFVGDRCCSRCDGTGRIEL